VSRRAPARETEADFLPSTAIPTQHFVDGLPTGIQAVGAYLEDRTTLRFATLVQERLGGFVRPPIGD
jgi:amidase